MPAEWTDAEIIKGARDAAAYLNCIRHPDASEWASACRLAASKLEQKAAPRAE